MARTLTDTGAVTATDDEQDSQLLKAIEQDDIASFECLYRRYHGRLSRFVSSTLGQTDLVDEIINDVMYVVWKKAASYDRKCKPSTWIFGVAYNKARKHFHPSKQPRLASIDDIEVDQEAVGEHQHWLELLEREDLCASILGSLSSEHRAVVELTYFYGMHYREICQIMGCPENTVKTRMFHARRHMQSVAKSLFESH